GGGNRGLILSSMGFYLKISKHCLLTHTFISLTRKNSGLPILVKIEVYTPIYFWHPNEKLEPKEEMNLSIKPLVESKGFVLSFSFDS
ncbi:MAG: hypothetical protein KJ645_14150, partial [Planctomycetes bacterium]|nr:hypothetical protein [Planctomycetota bacterium]